MGNIFLLEKLVGDTWDETKWAIQDNVKVVDDKAVYEFWYTEIVAEDDTQDTVLPALFEEITFPAALTNDQVAELEGFTVEVYAEAIQSEGFADDFAAWAAFEPEAQQK